ncbi:unnamed protein product [Rotaria socialis]|uniref:F-box domain-containing protein n=1 Tax=Rotaria socialis TaxID=392032 RepID=A0A818AY33_9BILA|nr:unnamed protein product [Rotaria socialis]CAF3364732.1 unnamed protein product [Rotaria socialis]CAF3412984.1 unnamed protein product [Rotaria socialis]CAF3728022.1 unnamed protein product [Rotaria socialis]CAF3730697.1 unnamed protein product [Rotaria socialis]
MNHSTVSTVALSDEMLITILMKLNNVDVLFSLIGVNKKLDRLSRDITFTQSIDFVTILSNKKRKSILDRFCFDIIPRIQHNIESLTLDRLSIDRVLRIGNYPKLWRLTLVNLPLKMAYDIFNDNFGYSPLSLINLSSTTFYLSSIGYLNVTVRHFNDCLCLLDERFTHLHTVIVKVEIIKNSSNAINNKVTYFQSRTTNSIRFIRER